MTTRLPTKTALAATRFGVVPGILYLRVTIEQIGQATAAGTVALLPQTIKNPHDNKAADKDSVGSYSFRRGAWYPLFTCHD
mmetsp:Transcript_89999/g.178906  ORF Transcript_89999/g.178906 Transcript_89999/m.178906 type:complete len:81 (+) Transcript_89999:86-328(+)